MTYNEIYKKLSFEKNIIIIFVGKHLHTPQNRHVKAIPFGRPLYVIRVQLWAKQMR